MADEPFQRAQSYNAAVTSIGYAGAFALLSYTHSDMLPRERATAAGCLLFSLAVFTLWVVGSMVGDTLVVMGRVPRHEVRPWSYVGLWGLALAGTLIPGAWAVVVMFKACWRLVTST